MIKGSSPVANQTDRQTDRQPCFSTLRIIMTCTNGNRFDGVPVVNWYKSAIEYRWKFPFIFASRSNTKTKHFHAYCVSALPFISQSLWQYFAEKKPNFALCVISDLNMRNRQILERWLDHEEYTDSWLLAWAWRIYTFLIAGLSMKNRHFLLVLKTWRIRTQKSKQGIDTLMLTSPNKHIHTGRDTP